MKTVAETVRATKGTPRNNKRLSHSYPVLAVRMEKTALLLFCCLVMSLSGSPLYPSIRFGQRDTAFLLTSLIEDPADHQDGAPRAEIRSERHADAIFTNSYRKVLGQISARKILQTIMGKRLGEKGVSYMNRQSDISEGTYKGDLTSIRSNRRHRAVHGRPRCRSPHVTNGAE
uniref:Somatoliberin n=2 Tax=Tetraodontidae TaxID=31031 RepID=A0A3B5K948_TAKRU